MYSYGPIPGSGHACQFTPADQKYSLTEQFPTFEDAVLFCKRNDLCGIVMQLTLKGGNEQQIFEVGSTSPNSCHCPQQNMQPFENVEAVWQKDKKIASGPPCKPGDGPIDAPKSQFSIEMYGPVYSDNDCSPAVVLGGSTSPVFIQKTNWKNDPRRARSLCSNSEYYFNGRKCDIIVKFTYQGNDYYELGNTQGTHCEYKHLKESDEMQQKKVDITVFEKFSP